MKRLLLVVGIVVMTVAIVAVAGSFSASAGKASQVEKPGVWDLTKLTVAILNGSDELPLSGEQMLETFGPIAEKGDPRAQLLLGYLYSRGLSVDADSEKAIYWLKKSAEQGNNQAAGLLGAEYLREYIASKERATAEKAIPYLKRYADDGDVTAATLLGNSYDKLEMYKEAAPYLTIAADAGDSDSQLALGLMYYRGDGVTKNLQLALKYFKEYLKATDNPAVQSVVGVIYFNIGGEENLAKAYEYFTVAANRGDPQGNSFLGIMYYLGIYVKADYDKARKYYDIAIKSNNAEAYYGKGALCEFGYNQEPNIPKAIQMYKKASELGVVKAQQHLEDIKKEHPELKELF